MRGILSTGVLANMAQWQDRTFEKRCILCSGVLAGISQVLLLPCREIRLGIKTQATDNKCVMCHFFVSC